jgi:hypothetical protein
MRYLLVVGLNCDVYRTPPLARISLGDQFVDEFQLKHNTIESNKSLKKFLSMTHPLEPYKSKIYDYYKFKDQPPLRFYELEIDRTLKEVQLCIEIENSYSNYTNGFMTASTLIQLNVCFLFPLNKSLIFKFKKIKNKNRLTQNYAWYRTFNTNIFNLNGINTKWNRRNAETIKSDIYTQFRNIGGNGYYSCNLVKKYGILIPKILKSYRLNFDFDFVNYYLDKYMSYAYKRNND